MNHAALYCKTLDALPRDVAINAIHAAYLQLRANGARVEQDGRTLDNAPAIAALGRCLVLAGHIGFDAPSRLATVHRRTFDALAHPEGSPERVRLNLDALHSQYLTGSPYLVRVPAFMSDGTPNPAQAFHNHTFRTKGEAEGFAAAHNSKL